MTMHQGIDLSRFKKVASDGKTSTLRHSKGHEIRIAHQGLTERMREHLNNMPVHLAEGGDGIEPIKEEDDDSKVLTDIPEMEEAEKQDAGELAPQQEPAQEAEAPLVVDDITPSTYTAPQPQQEPVEQEQQNTGNSLDEKMQEHIDHETDMAAGHIHPKTYQDMFADKSTLGKIGTLFGLLLSGAGSGLTHQPNMVMEMMNKEIERDLERQKMDKENARNFLSLQYQHNLQKAQAADHMQNVLSRQVETAPKAAGASQYLQSMGTPGAYNFMQDFNRKAAEVWAPFEAKAKMYQAAGDHLTKITANNPRASGVVQSQVKPAIAQAVANTLKQGDLAVKKTLSTSAAENRGRQYVVDEQKLGDAIRLGQNTPDGMGYMPGAINPHDVPAVQREKAELKFNRDGAQSWNDSFDKLANMRMAGQAPGISEAATGVGGLIGALTGGVGAGVGAAVSHGIGKISKSTFERDRNIEKEALKQRLGKNLSKDDKEELVDSLLPSWNDDEKSMAEAHRKGIEHFRDMEAMLSPTLDTYAQQIPGLKAPFPALHFKKAQPKKNEKNKTLKSH